MSKQTTGEFMATLRKANGYTQQEVAEKLNVSNRTLSSWETDRTLPDVLMLPAIADLYNVTVDELLRGERNTSDSKSVNEISENSLKSVYKNKFGSFVTKYALIIGIALTCIALFIIGCALTLWTTTPAWLDWVLLILSIVGLCICIAVVAYQYNNVKLAVGVVLDEDLTEDRKAFITTLRNKLESFVSICALPFTLFALVILILFVAINPEYEKVMGYTLYVREGYIFIICINFAMAAILFAVYLILKLITIKTFYSETQKAIAKFNLKFAGKLALFGIIPIVTVFIVNIILAIAFPNDCKTLYKNSDLEAFRTHMHTLVIDENDPQADVAPQGEYYLAISKEEPENGTEFDFGNGFYGKYQKYAVSFPDFEYYSEKYVITYGKPQPQEPSTDESEDESDEYATVPSWDLYVYRFDDKYVVNARYYLTDHSYNGDGTRAHDISVTERHGKYYLVEDISDTLTDVAVYTLTIVPICAIVACVVVYAVKRKKQKYGF